MMRPAAPTALLFALAATLGTGLAAAAPLPDRSQAVIRQQLVPDEAVTVVIRDVATGDSLVEMNADAPRTPASIMKLLPTFAALDILGPAYTWKTRALADGPVEGGVLKGNLYLQGGGDPLLVIERWWRFAASLRQSGLKAIAGDVVIDEEYLAPATERPGDFDGRPWRTYNVLPHALLVNWQSVEFTVRPNDARDAIDVAIDPFPANLVVDNRLRAVDARCAGRNRSFSVSQGDADPARVVVSGTVSVRCPPQTVRRVVMRPAEYAFGTFRTLWEQQGGRIEGGMLRAPTPPAATLLLTQESPTLGEIVRVTNKFSSNVMARMLLLTLAAEKAGTPATRAAGEKVIHDWLEERGLEFPELVIGNGSGLSREARISGESMSRLLRAAWQGRYAPEFLGSLSLGGLDGTLRERFSRISDPSRIRMKTGTLNGVSSIAGFVTGKSGRTYTVVVMVNHPGAQHGSGEAIQGSVISWVLDQ